MNTINHDEVNLCFYIQDGDLKSLLEYRVFDCSGVKTIDFHHTFVPPELRHKGYAAALVRHGLAWAREAGYAIQASCWYVDKFLK